MVIMCEKVGTNRMLTYDFETPKTAFTVYIWYVTILFSQPCSQKSHIAAMTSGSHNILCTAQSINIDRESTHYPAQLV